MCIEKEKAELCDYLNIEHNIVQNLLFEAKCLSPPDVYILEDKDPSITYKKLALDDVIDSTLYILEPISDVHQIVQCWVNKFLILLFFKSFFFRFVAKVFLLMKNKNFFNNLGMFIYLQIITKSAK